MDNHNLKCRRTITDAFRIADSNVLGPSALKRNNLNGSRYVIRRTKRFLPSIPRIEEVKGDRDNRSLRCDGPESKTVRACNQQFSSPTTQAKQLMPTNVRQFWLQRKPSLAIHPSTFYHDIDAFSIEMIREHNQPHLVLPSLRGKLK